MGVLCIITPDNSGDYYTCKPCGTRVAHVRDIKCMSGIFNNKDVCFTFLAMINTVTSQDTTTLTVNGNSSIVSNVHCKQCNKQLGYKHTDFLIFNGRIV